MVRYVSQAERDLRPEKTSLHSGVWKELGAFVWVVRPIPEGWPEEATRDFRRMFRGADDSWLLCSLLTYVESSEADPGTRI
jgi:uncharacterized protein YbaA (DUF1428 family)